MNWGLWIRIVLQVVFSSVILITLVACVLALWLAIRKDIRKKD